MDEATKSVNIATNLIQACEIENIEFNTVQAAFGEGWIRCLKVMGCTREDFLRMSQEIADLKFLE
jgi:hypothetical protein